MIAGFGEYAGTKSMNRTQGTKKTRLTFWGGSERARGGRINVGFGAELIIAGPAGECTRISD